MLLFTDSFDDRYNPAGPLYSDITSRVVAKYTSYNIDTFGNLGTATGGRTGTYALSFRSDYTGPSFYLRKTFSSRTVLIVGCAIKLLNSSSYSNVLFRILDNGKTQLKVRVNSDQTLSVLNYADTVLGTTSLSNVLTTNYTYVEFKAGINSITGMFELKGNGNTWLNGSSLNTVNPSSMNNYATDVDLCWQLSGNISGPLIDDYYIADTLGTKNNDFLNAVKVFPSVPMASGAAHQWIPSGAVVNYQCVKELDPDDDHTHVYSSTVGDKDLYVFDPFTPSSGSVKRIIAIQTNIRARKDELGPRQICITYKDGSTFFDGDTIDLNTVYSYSDYQDIQDTDPNTGLDWSISAINALQAGVKVIG